MQLLNIKCSTNGEDAMRLHNEDDIEDLADRNINILTHIYDRAGIFNCREDAEKGSVVICDTIEKQGLAVCVGYDDKKSKTKLVRALSTSKLKEQRNYYPLQLKSLKYNKSQMLREIALNAKKKANFDIVCNNCPE